MPDWSLSTPSTILPSLILPPPPDGPPAPPQATSSEPAARAEIAGTRLRRISSPPMGCSDAEVVQELVLALGHLGVVERLHHPSAVEQVVAVGDGGGEPDVLLDQQHRHAGRLDVAQDVA